jgi:hypothetical protein
VLVVADTSVLLNLCRVGHEHLLPALFQEVQIPPAVHGEFVQLAQSHSRFRGLTLPGWVKTSEAVTVPNEITGWPNLEVGPKPGDHYENVNCEVLEQPVAC